MLEKIKKVKIKDLMGFLVLLIALPIAFCVKLKNRISKKSVWLICELKDTCRDNGYHFFKYMREKHPEFKCYYAIDIRCDDYDKIKEYGNIVKFGSIKHWVLYLASDFNISTHKEGNPNHTIFTFLHLYLNLFNNRVFLQHGITKDNVPMFYYKNTRFRYFICGAKDEYEYIKNNFGYPQENVVYTGFARFDNLHNNVINRKKILVIPTWRRWFELESDKKVFINSDYFNKWSDFLNNKKLNDFLKEKNYELVFYPHYQMRKFIDCFEVESENIKIVKDDVQKLLKESAFMITDYSSVYMDFAYMKKAIIYYQFDFAQYRSSHLSEGYFNYENNGFGEVVDNVEDLIDLVIEYGKNEFNVKAKYRNRMDSFFELNDNKNCERIYNILNTKSEDRND